METLAELFSFQGRANRSNYIIHQIVDDFIIFVLVMLMIFVGFATGVPLIVLPLAGLLIGGVTAATAVTVRRLHDMNMSGWHVLGMMVPLWNVYLGFKLVFVKGTLGPNYYGQDPLMPNVVMDDHLLDDGYEYYEADDR